MQPKIVVVMGPDALETLNELALPLAREVRAEPGELQQLTPSIDALYTPNIDDALDEEAPSARSGARSASLGELVRGASRRTESARSRPRLQECEHPIGAGARVRRPPVDQPPSAELDDRATRLGRQQSPGRSCRACRRPGSARRPRRRRRAGTSRRRDAEVAGDEAGQHVPLDERARRAPCPRASGRAASRRGCGRACPSASAGRSRPSRPRRCRSRTIRPRMRERARGCRPGSGAPTSSRITSNGPSSAKSVGRDRVDAERARSARGVLVAHRRGDARAGHRARAARRPCRRRPRRRGRAAARRPSGCAWVKSASWAVVKTSGTPPAAVQSSSSGTGIARRSWTTASSAWPPPATTAITRSPGSKRVTPRPTLDHLARQLEARDVLRRARRRRIAPGQLHHVGAVEAGGA